MVALLCDAGSADTSHSMTAVPSPSLSQGQRGPGAVGKEIWAGDLEQSTHIRTGLMAFLMLPKAARPSSSRRHLSASSAGFSFSFSGAWRGEGDRLWRQSHVDKGWGAKWGARTVYLWASLQDKQEFEISYTRS